ncbi:MAG: class II aldolase/adducin family protein [Alicyclobacillus sp.]|nr:class II aldolase/adducin family protein [Alicyclobacillus sp.]
MDDAVQALLRAARYLAERQLSWGNSGNLSIRAGDTVFITASGAFLSDLSADEFIACTLEGPPANPQRRPSKELPFHQAIYQVRDDVRCVLHVSPFYSTLIACSRVPLQTKLFVEAMYYLYDVAEIPYHHPGSQALADAVRACADRTNVMLLRNHGVIVYDTSVQEAVARLETLEIASRMSVIAHSGNMAVSPPDPKTIDDFIRNSGYKPVLPRGLLE